MSTDLSLIGEKAHMEGLLTRKPYPLSSAEALCTGNRRAVSTRKTVV
jgi:hypothetical protein